jgi:hypothetical protein
MREFIESQLEEIEDAEGIRIFFACESGSRAWGFPSADSDYDVRFLYVQRRDWYLSIDVERKADVVERPIDGALDVNGWDLRKALQLLRRGSPPLVEWLRSPIVYREVTSVPERLRGLAAEYYSRPAALYHYLHMARGNYREYLRGPVVSIKTYFYVLRPLLAVRWIERDLGVVPTEFGKLVEGTVDAPGLRREIDALIRAKRQGEELDRAPRVEAISAFIEVELGWMEGRRFEEEYERVRAPVGELNRFFRGGLEEVWES